MLYHSTKVKTREKYVLRLQWNNKDTHTHIHREHDGCENGAHHNNRIKRQTILTQTCL